MLEAEVRWFRDMREMSVVQIELEATQIQEVWGVLCTFLAVLGAPLNLLVDFCAKFFFELYKKIQIMF